MLTLLGDFSVRVHVLSDIKPRFILKSTLNNHHIQERAFLIGLIRLLHVKRTLPQSVVRKQILAIACTHTHLGRALTCMWIHTKTKPQGEISVRGVWCVAGTLMIPHILSNMLRTVQEVSQNNFFFYSQWNLRDVDQLPGSFFISLSHVWSKAISQDDDDDDGNYGKGSYRQRAP